jgi:hypothetical protein
MDPIQPGKAATLPDGLWLNVKHSHARSCLTSVLLTDATCGRPKVSPPVTRPPLVPSMQGSGLMCQRKKNLKSEQQRERPLHGLQNQPPEETAFSQPLYVGEAKKKQEQVSRTPFAKLVSSDQFTIVPSVANAESEGGLSKQLMMEPTKTIDYPKHGSMYGHFHTSALGCCTIQSRRSAQILSWDQQNRRD